MNDYIKDLGFLAAMVLAGIGVYLIMSVEQEKAQHRVIQVPAVLTQSIIK